MAKGKPNDPDTLEKQAEVVMLRKGGMTFDGIAERVGYADRTGAFKAWRSAMNKRVAPHVQELREQENDRLNDVFRVAFTKMVNDHDMEAARVCIAVSNAVARLNGLDAPQQIEIQAEVVTESRTLGEVIADDPELERLAQEAINVASLEVVA